MIGFIQCNEELVEEETPPEPEISEPPVAEVAAIAAAAAVVASAPNLEPEVQEEVVFEEFVQEPEPQEPEVVVVQQGNHADEFATGHYIVVGAFLSRANAAKYSNSLKAKGYDNEFAFLTAKDFYYVTVYKNLGDIETARSVRNEYRQKSDFLFPDAWLLSVVK